jgi:hypothetical protein
LDGTKLTKNKINSGNILDFSDIFKIVSYNSFATQNTQTVLVLFTYHLWKTNKIVDYH